MEYTTISPVALLLNARQMRGDGEAAYGQVVAVIDKLATNGGAHTAIMSNSRSKTGGPVGAEPEASASASPASANQESRK